MSATTYRLPPRECASQLANELSGRSMDLHIEWKWVGRDRAGRIVIRDRNGNCVYTLLYLRGNQRWNNTRDADIFVCNTGSQKHEALLHALQFVQTQQS
jgi:hypothetical protein